MLWVSVRGIGDGSRGQGEAGQEEGAARALAQQECLCTPGVCRGSAAKALVHWAAFTIILLPECSLCAAMCRRHSPDLLSPPDPWLGVKVELVQLRMQV